MDARRQLYMDTTWSSTPWVSNRAVCRCACAAVACAVCAVSSLSLSVPCILLTVDTVAPGGRARTGLTACSGIHPRLLVTSIGIPTCTCTSCSMLYVCDCQCHCVGLWHLCASPESALPGAAERRASAVGRTCDGVTPPAASPATARTPDRGRQKKKEVRTRSSQCADARPAAAGARARG